MQDYYANLERLLYDQDGELSRRLKSAALIILSAEELRSCVEQKALLFFGLQKELSWRRDDDPLPIEYEGLRSKKQADRLRAASLWFQSVGTFSEDDFELVRLAMNYRNEVAHELLEALLYQSPDFFAPEVPFAMVCLAHKINVWWMKNYEFEDDCNESLDVDKAEQLSTAIVRLITLAAFPELSEVPNANET